MNTTEMISLFRNFVNETPYDADTQQTALFWKDQDIMEYLNISQIHYNSFVHDLDESYNISVKDYSYIENANPQPDLDILDSKTIQIPNDAQKVKMIEVLSQTGDTFGFDCKPVNITEKNRLFTFGSGFLFRYYFQNNQLKFLPELPKGGNIVRLYYLRRLPKLVNGTDISQLPEECHENVVMYAVTRGLLRDKQNSLAASWEKDLQAKDAWLANTIKPRTAQEANTVLWRDDWAYNRASGYFY